MVNNHVKTVYFKTQMPIPRRSIEIICQRWLNRNHGFNNQVFNFFPGFVPVELLGLVGFNKSLEAPLARIFLFLVFLACFFVV